MTDENLCMDPGRLCRPGRFEGSMDTDDSCEFRAAACQFKNCHASEAVTHRSDSAVDGWMVTEDIQSRLRPLVQGGGIAAQFRDPLDHTLTIAGDAFPVHVACEGDETRFRKAKRAGSGMIVETGSSMDNQNPRATAARRRVPGEKTIKQRVVVTIWNSLRFDHQAASPLIVRL
jgi:hypothetical protein